MTRASSRKVASGYRKETMPEQKLEPCPIALQSSPALRPRCDAHSCAAPVSVSAKSTLGASSRIRGQGRRVWPRLPLALLVIGSSLGAGPAAAQTQDLDGLERAWHGCVREAYARQTPGQSRAGAQRNVLDECRAHEDSLVAATMALREREDEAARRAGLPLTIRAGAWAASVAAYVVDPVASWLQGRQH